MLKSLISLINLTGMKDLKMADLFGQYQSIKTEIDKLQIPYNEIKYLSNSDFFLQGSYVEGFPNCLIESCSVGTPIIAFRALGGLNEIIEEGINGFIADNEDEYVEKIVESTTIHQWNSKVISDSVKRKFNKEKILQQYEELFHEL